MTESTKRILTISDPGQREIIEAAAAVAASLKVPAFIVGGFIRDSLLGRRVHDLDLAVLGDAATFAEALAKRLDAPIFTLHLEAGMYRLTLQSQAFDQVDISTAAGTIVEALSRRDFTVDAMAAAVDDLATANGQAEIIEPAGGLNDLKNKVLRAVAPDIFQKDPARLLRGARLAAELGFSIEPATERLIIENAPLAASGHVKTC